MNAILSRHKITLDVLNAVKINQSISLLGCK